MKQEITSCLFSLQDKIYEISRYLYEYPEESFKEHKTVDYITKLLISKNFKVNKNFMNIPTAFQAEFGEGYPKICFLCEYDGDGKKGQIYGNNLTSAISLAAAISLSKSLNKPNGTITVIGTPGELQGGTKTTMEKQKAFTDLDAIMIVRPHLYNMVDSDYQANLPLKIVFFGEQNLRYTPKDAYIFILDFLNFFMKGLDNNCCIQSFSLEDCQLKLDIKAGSIEIASLIRNNIELISDTISKLTGLRQEISLSNVPCSEVTKSNTLNRLFSHNLKECGIINIDDSDCDIPNSSLGCISKTVPCMNAYISIVENSNIKYPSIEFAKKTLSDYAQDIALKAAQALAFTGLDLIEKQQLLAESKTEINVGV